MLAPLGNKQDSSQALWHAGIQGTWYSITSESQECLLWVCSQNKSRVTPTPQLMHTVWPQRNCKYRDFFQVYATANIKCLLLKVNTFLKYI